MASLLLGQWTKLTCMLSSWSSTRINCRACHLKQHAQMLLESFIHVVAVGLLPFSNMAGSRKVKTVASKATVFSFCPLLSRNVKQLAKCIVRQVECWIACWLTWTYWTWGFTSAQCYRCCSALLFFKWDAVLVPLRFNSVALYKDIHLCFCTEVGTVCSVRSFSVHGCCWASVACNWMLHPKDLAIFCVLQFSVLMFSSRYFAV